MLLKLRTIIRNAERRREWDDELDGEVRGYVEMLADEKVREGMTPEEARREARIELGGVEQVKEQVREARAGAWLNSLLQDVRFGARMLRKSPGFTIVAVLTLALGIGANTAIFSATNTLLLRSLPIPDSDRVVFSVSMREWFDPFGSSLLEYTAYKGRSHSFERLGLAQERSFNLVGRDEPERVQGGAVDPDFLRTLGVQPILGRTITETEARPGGPAVAILSYGLWQRRFGADSNIVGATTNLDGTSTTIIGVLPPGFDYPFAAHIWVPLQTPLYGLPMADMAAHNYDIVGRLRPGATVRQADDDLAHIARDLEKEYPTVRRGWGVKVIPLIRQVLWDIPGRVEKSLLALLGAVGFLLLICCANVASLLIARGVAREREIAVRRAMGATWSRIIGQLITESSLLALLGGMAGVALAYSILPVLSSLNPVETTSFADVLRDLHVDGRVLIFACVITLLTGIVSGLLPALKGSTVNDLMPLIQEGTQRAGRGNTARLLLGSLVVAEIAVAVTLLTGGALIVQSFQRLQKMDLGYNPDGLLTMHMELSPKKYRDFPQRLAFVRNVITQVRQVPGVGSTGITTNMPVGIFSSRDAMFEVEGHPITNVSETPATSHRLVTPDYLQTLGVTLVEGRLLNESDRQGTQPVVVITEELAREGWPHEDPLGKHIKRVIPGVTDFPWMTVVGVVKNVKEDRDNFRINRPVWYLPYEQQPNDFAFDLVVRANANAAALAPAIRSAILEVDPDQPVSNVITMRDHLQGMVATEHFSAILMTSLAGIGVVLAVIGIYGVTAYTVSRQTGEIAVRMALGASRGGIFKMVIARGTKLVLAGMVIGLPLTVALTQLIATTLYGVRANDPVTFAAITVFLFVVAIASCYLPARYAMRIAPTMALRHE